MKPEPKPSEIHRKALKQYYLGIAFFIIAVLALVAILIIPDKQKTKLEAEASYGFNPQGVVYFIDEKGKPLCEFSAEIAETPEKQLTGLMYRDSLAADQAMLFLMNRTEVQNFWMKNTYLPLDIIFIGEDSTIVHIASNTTPFSEEQINSQLPARYVVEVNAGIAAQKNIKPGCKFSWERI
ncbi:MAG: DUF192 domain-containing protein [Candidatus Cloacimonadaceae bacterium]